MTDKNLTVSSTAHSKDEHRSPEVWILSISVIVAIIAGYFGEKYPSIEIHSILIFSVASALFVFEIGELHGRHSLRRKIANLDRIHQILIDELAAFRKTQTVLKELEPLTHPNRYPSLRRLAELARDADATWHLSELELFAWKQSDILDDTNGRFLQLAEGNLVIDSPAKELIANTQFLCELCKTECHAVSYQDEEFWKSAQGLNFLEQHKVALGKGIRIQRIFIVETKELDQIESVLSSQAKIGIDVRIVFVESIKGKLSDCIRDFVVYDNTYVRFAQLPPQANNLIDKEATLSRNPGTVASFVDRYKALLNSSRPYQAGQPKAAGNP